MLHLNINTYKRNNYMHEHITFVFMLAVNEYRILIKHVQELYHSVLLYLIKIIRD